MPGELNRRSFVGIGLAASAGAAIGGAVDASSAFAREKSDAPAPSAPPQPGGALPKGKFGDLQMSRLILGTNHITFHMHSRDLRYVRELSKAYNTEEKILETFAVAEANGVDTFATHHDPTIIKLVKKHREQKGGKLQLIVAPQPNITDPSAFGQDVQHLVDEGADAIYVHGALTGKLISKGEEALIGKLVQVIKASGVQAGVAAHGLNVVQYCEKEKFPIDFYVKTFHHLKYPTAPKPEEAKGDFAEIPGYWCSQPEETAEFMKTVAKPWIAFKVMAAGAIPPREAFKYAYSNGADFILAGMFDFQLAEDAQIAREVLASLKTRPRPWRA